jgi:hypothetical protein
VPDVPTRPKLRESLVATLPYSSVTSLLQERNIRIHVGPRDPVPVMRGTCTGSAKTGEV